MSDQPDISLVKVRAGKPFCLRSLLARVAWLALAGVMLFPLVWMIQGSLKGSNLEIFEHPFALPRGFHLENFQRAARAGNLASYLVNSLLVTVITAFLVVVLGAWAGFALSKTRFPFRRFWFALFFVGMVLPVQAYLIPLGDVLQALGIQDSLWALIFSYTAQILPVAALLLAAYFQGLPVELEEAARIDGVSTARFYFTILLPVAKPAIATVIVISCLNTWNEFLLAMLFIVDPAMRTLPIGMIAFEQSHNTDYPALLAGLTMITLPALLAYAIFNRQVIRGVVAGTVK
jgi:raffinose/stachyose/melibiose transport system permease protein